MQFGLSDDRLSNHLRVLRRLRFPLILIIGVSAGFLTIPTNSTPVKGTAYKNKTAANQDVETKAVSVDSTVDNDPKIENDPEVENVDVNIVDPVDLGPDHQFTNSTITSLEHLSGWKTFGTAIGPRKDWTDQFATSAKDFAVWAARRKIANANTERQPLVIRNSNENIGKIAFLLDKKVVHLEPGEEKVIDDGEQHVIRFHRGGSFGEGQHVLNRGQHCFVAKSTGWQLVAEQ